MSVIKEYEARNIFNTDETGLFFKCLPEKNIYIQKRKMPSVLNSQASPRRIWLMWNDTLTEFNAEPSLWEALPEQDLTFDDYVLVDTDIAVWGALSDAKIVALDHNNTESDEDE
ncbi:hypothetical protein TNCV_4816211 [Trichonephila clavipes]|nr:hypothetical protein TNCV_4816211 [Trichonephila clavipes]